MLDFSLSEFLHFQFFKVLNSKLSNVVGHALSACSSVGIHRFPKRILRKTDLGFLWCFELSWCPRIKYKWCWESWSRPRGGVGVGRQEVDRSCHNSISGLISFWLIKQQERKSIQRLNQYPNQLRRSNSARQGCHSKSTITVPYRTWSFSASPKWALSEHVATQLRRGRRSALVGPGCAECSCDIIWHTSWPWAMSPGLWAIWTINNRVID